MWEYNDTNELCHWGIKGMRWGVRRFQNKDGSLTPAGRKRYDDDDSNPKVEKSTHRSRLEAKYRQQGMSEAAAKAAANKRIKIEKIVAVTAGLTLAAATAYVANKYVKERVDGVIKAGSKLQVVANDANKDLNRPFYAAYKKSDNTKYKGLLGQQLRTRSNEVHKLTLTADQNIKVASRQKAAEAFANLYKTDPEFREAFAKSNSIFADSHGLAPKRDRIIKIASGKMTSKQLMREGYDAFNIGLVNHDENGNAIAKKFYSKLKDQGYNAILDVNDNKYSGYNSKKPVIIFNKANKISLSDVKKLTDAQIASNANKVMNDAAVKELAKQGAIAAGTLGSLSLMSKTMSSIAVDNYRIQHPKTNKSDAEILKMLSGN